MQLFSVSQALGEERLPLSRDSRNDQRMADQAEQVSITGLVDTKQQSDPAEMAARYGAEKTVPDWRARLICSRCGGREVNMIVTRTERG